MALKPRCISLCCRDMTFSAGYTYTKAGDVKIVHEAAPGVPSGLTLDYKGNSVSGFGVKLGYTFKSTFKFL